MLNHPVSSYTWRYTSRQRELRPYLNGPLHEDTVSLMRLLRNRQYKAIVVYPEAAPWEDQSRVHRFLSKLASSGYLCFYCEPDTNGFSVREREINLLVCSGEGPLLAVLRSSSVIVLCTELLQTAFADLLPNKVIWYDLLQNPASLTDEHQINKHHQLCSQAVWVTAGSPLIGQVPVTFVPDEADLLQGLERRIHSTWKGWTVYANLQVPEIAIQTGTFFDYVGRSFYCGGAERYAVDLFELSQELGLTCTLYQYGDYPWVRRYKGMDVVSLSRGGQQTRPLKKETLGMFNRLFQEQVKERALLHLYSSYFNAWPYENDPSRSIGIIHGVAWDHERCDYKNGTAFWEVNRRYIEGAERNGWMVSVDTNSANWFQTIKYSLAQKIKVIPNYVNLVEFYPSSHPGIPNGNEERIIILYPRRLYKPRGLYLVLEVMDSILERYPHVDFHLVGQGVEEDLMHIYAKQEQWGSRVMCYSKALEDMAEVYRQADICLIPTRFSEGTSLSCLEAMASGNAIIATRVGGLTDLILNNYNGLLIEPEAGALKEAIEELLTNPAKRTILQQKAIETAVAFSKDQWKSKWRRVIQDAVSVQEMHRGLRATPLPEKGSINGRLVLVRLNQLPRPYSTCSNLIAEYLQAGDLVYIQIQGRQADRALSFGRCQWIGWDEVLYDVPNLIVSESGLDVPYVEGMKVQVLTKEEV